MARNQVQFQKGLSEASFSEIYGTEEQCHAALVKWRWPNGFECPGCKGADHCVVTRGARRLFQCNACRKQTSVKAGTIFASSKLPLRIWFKTIYLVTQSKKGISSIELGRRLGVTQTAAWMMKHKLAQVMLERNASKRLKGNVQMDDAYIGGARSGRRGRGATGKTPFVAAIATTDDGKPDQIALMPEAKRAQHKKVVVRPRVASPDETPAIEAEGLTRQFGDFVAVDHVSFRIARGEIFGFLGSNGCGKSTTMKMLTGFLPATSGSCKLFGQPMGSSDMEARRNVGYMTQAFSLYGELTVRQNLELHAQLYHLPLEKIAPRIKELLERYDLKDFVNARPDSLPLGIKQRLQLAVAVLHEPSILILDEPTSGVDPIARDAFWRTLIDLSRDDAVTIFVTTHFMNEAERCDRISLMHAGKVLAVGAPLELVEERGGGSLEDTFVGYLAEAAGIDRSKKVEAPPAAAETIETEPLAPPKHFDLARLWAYARRETVELLRDPIRMAFAVFGPIILMFAFGYGISFDIENLATAAFDQDHTPQSRELLQGFEGSRYFSMQPPIKSAEEAERRLKSGNTQIVVEAPPVFGRDLLNDRKPEVDATVDGAMTFRGETAKNYVNGVVRKQGEELQREVHRPGTPNAWNENNIDTRFRYNQAFLSVNAMVPSVFMLMLCLIPAIMSAIAVVREKETGSIANFRSTPITKFEFLIGKQLPYVAVAMVNFVFLFLMAIFIFNVPIKGPFLTLLIATFVYVFATTGFGQLISSFVRTQVAAVFATAIFSIVPAVNFSGLFAPVSSLSGTARIIGLSFPSAWYQPVTVGVFAKALGMIDLWRNVAAITIIALAFLALSLVLLRKQEA